MSGSNERRASSPNVGDLAVVARRTSSPNVGDLAVVAGHARAVLTDAAPIGSSSVVGGVAVVVGNDRAGLRRGDDAVAEHLRAVLIGSLPVGGEATVGDVVVADPAAGPERAVLTEPPPAGSWSVVGDDEVAAGNIRTSLRRVLRRANEEVEERVRAVLIGSDPPRGEATAGGVAVVAEHARATAP